MSLENKIPAGTPRVTGFVIAPHVVFDDGVVLRQGPPVAPITVASDGLAAFAEEWPEILAEFALSFHQAQAVQTQQDGADSAQP